MLTLRRSCDVTTIIQANALDWFISLSVQDPIIIRRAAIATHIVHTVSTATIVGVHTCLNVRGNNVSSRVQVYSIKSLT